MPTDRTRLRLLELAAIICIFNGLVTLQGSPGRSTISPIFLVGAVIAIYCVLEERRLRRAQGAAEIARTATARAVGWRPDRLTIAGITVVTVFVGVWLLALFIGLSGGP